MSEQGVANISGSAELGDNLEYIGPLLQSLDQIPRERVNLTRSCGRPRKHIRIRTVLAHCSMQLLLGVSICELGPSTVMVDTCNPP